MKINKRTRYGCGRCWRVVTLRHVIRNEQAGCPVGYQSCPHCGAQRGNGSAGIIDLRAWRDMMGVDYWEHYDNL